MSHVVMSYLEDPHEKHSRVTEAFLCKQLYYHYIYDAGPEL